MSFGAIVSRGFAAAHKTPAGFLLLLLISGVQQLIGAIYVPYLVLVNASLATSLYLARRDGAAVEEGPFPAEVA